MPIFFADWINQEEKATYQVPVINLDLKEEKAAILHKRQIRVVKLSEISFARWE